MRVLKRAVFLDRDGVLNEAVIRNGRPYPPADVLQLRLMPEVESCLADLHQRGFLLIVVTNQPDVARGLQSRICVEEMHAVLKAQLPLDDVLVCYHDDGDRCGCRKPAPGLLIQAADKHGITLSRSFMIGDRWKDVEAGRNAGCRSVFIDYGYEEQGPQGAAFEVHSLREAVNWILDFPAPVDLV
jgi:D-glycero-D-manno-heptose 1,7-bisphosphate phosphatase